MPGVRRSAASYNQAIVKRFFFAGLIDDHIRLTPDQRTAVQKSVTEQAGRERGATLLRLAPGMLALLLIPVWQHLGRAYGTALNVVFQLAFVGTIMALIWWQFRRAYQKYARRAIRELGFADICARCGYDLSGRTEDPARCPECGFENHPFAGDPVPYAPPGNSDEPTDP